jgi:hypothetical protein
MKALALEFTTNIFGKLKPEIKERLQKVIDTPTQETWDDTFSIILNTDKGITTLWQAVLKVDPSFCKSKGSECKWDKIPSREVIIEAINRVVFQGNKAERNN